jgi:hypothetical protein
LVIAAAVLMKLLIKSCNSLLKQLPPLSHNGHEVAHTKAQQVYRVGYDLGQLTGKLGPLLRHDVSLLQKQLYVFALGELLAGCY